MKSNEMKEVCVPSESGRFREVALCVRGGEGEVFLDPFRDGAVALRGVGLHLCQARVPGAG